MPARRTTTLLVMAAQGISSLLAVLVVALLARRLGTHELGIYLYFVAIAAGLEALSDLGLRIQGVAALSRPLVPGGRARLLDRLWMLKLALSTGTGLLILAAWWLGLIRFATLPDVVLVALVCVTLPSSSPVVWDARAAGLQSLEAVLLIGYRLLLLLAAWWVQPAAADARTMLVTLFAANVAFMLTLMIVSGRRVDARNGAQAVVAPPAPRHLLQQAIPLGLSLLAAQFIPRLWIMLLAFVATTSQLAAFSVSVTVLQTVLLISVAVSAVYLPLLSRLAQEDIAGLQRTSEQLLSAMLVVGGGIAVIAALCAPLVMPWVFGAALRDAALYVVLLCVLAPLLLFSYLARIILGALQAGRDDLLAVLMGALAGGFASAALSPALGIWAIVGGYLTAEVVSAIAKALALRRRLRVRSPISGSLVGRVAVMVTLAVASGLWLYFATSPRWWITSLALTAGLLAYGFAVLGSQWRRRLLQLLP